MSNDTGKGSTVQVVLSPAEVERTRAKLAKINARAAKRGFTGRFDLEVGPAREIVEPDPNGGLTRRYVVVDATITGQAPCYGGWEFVAAVDLVEVENGADGFVLRCAPGIDASAIDRDALVPGRCEHCRTRRANRIYTYLLREQGTGRTVQVGSTCLRDFLGWDGRPVFIDADAVREELDQIGRGGPDQYTPATVVAVALAAAKTYGWVSRSNPNGRATSTAVDQYLYGHSQAAKEVRSDLDPIIGAAEAEAGAVIAAVLAAAAAAPEDTYLANLAVILRGQAVDPRHLGMAVSTVAAHRRLVAASQAQHEAETRPAPEYTGSVGDKITVTGTITTLTSVETAWGSSYLIAVDGERDGRRVLAKMFTSAAWVHDDDVERGAALTLTGTVKAHETYRDQKQTVLTRVKRTQHTD